MHYCLDEWGNPIPEPDLLKWAAWFERADRCVGNDTVGLARVFTVFLGLDYGFGGAPPVLWETVVFGGPCHGDMELCSGSREQAEAAHARALERARLAAEVSAMARTEEETDS